MCYKVATHTLVCDVRPLVFNGEDILVDTFTAPLKCDCEPDPCVKPWFRCEYHGCCRVTEKMLWCPAVEDCAEVIELDRYDQVRRQRNIGAWDSINTLDESLFPYTGLPHVSEMSSLFEQSLIDLIRRAREITQITLMLGSARAGVDKMREVHNNRHWACEKTLSELECSHLKLVAEAQDFADVCQKLSDKAIWQFETCWWLLQSNWKTAEDLGTNLKILETKETKEDVLDNAVAEEVDDERMNMLILKETLLAIEAD